VDNPNEPEGCGKVRARLFLLSDAFFVEGQLASESDQFTSQRGALAENG
jgi:hypothetical protein